MKIALIQMPVVPSKEENLCKAREMAETAKAKGADALVLPEMFCCPYQNRYFREYAEEERGKIWHCLSEIARDLQVLLIGGSMPEKCGDAIYNTCYVFDETGKQIARHRKVHLFDVDIQGGQHFRESDTFTPGNEITVFDSAFGRFGVMICFDIRFPELSRLMMLKGAQAVFVPAAFNMTTGPAHWELSFRQRALDNQFFMAGCAPARDASASYVSYANSIVTGPWGNVLERAGEREEILLAELDFSESERVRAQLPLIPARRTDLYAVLEKE